MKEVEVKIVVKKFEAKDGTQFENKESAIKHERIIDGEIKLCVNCNGTGQRSEKEIEDAKAWGALWPDEKCKCCKGKGYLELAWV